jgi:hypothetical protein
MTDEGVSLVRFFVNYQLILNTILRVILRKDGVAITTGMPKYPIVRIKFVMFAVETRCMSPGPVRLLRGRAYLLRTKKRPPAFGRSLFDS